MTTTEQDLNYIASILQAAEKRNSYPAIFLLWGIIVFFGFAIGDINVNWMTPYWLGATPLGMVLSTWLGMRHDRKTGISQAGEGDDYLAHFGVTVVLIFLAIFTQRTDAILLLISLSYCLAGIHLDRNMVWVGTLAAAVYIALFFGLINSHTLIGAIFAIGFFVSAGVAARQRVAS